MRHSLASIFWVLAIGTTLIATGSPAFAKTIKECDAEYAANKDAIKGAGQKKADFVAACRAGNEVIPGGTATAVPAPAPAPSTTAAPVAGKTAKECGAEYSANKAAIKAVGQKKADFIASCRASNETIPTGAATAPAAAPTPAAPAPSADPMAPKPVAPPSTMGVNTAPRPLPPVTASEAQAQASCPGATVVWVNTRSGIYHFRGTHNYGTTKVGTYMCEAAAKAAGDRAAENEKHP